MKTPSLPQRPAKTLTTPSFEEAVGGVLRGLGTLLLELITHIAGRGANTVDVQRELGVDKKLAWQIFRLATAEDVMGEAANVPARRSFVRLLAVARERGAHHTLIEQLEEVFERFESLVVEHAGDRSSLDAMIAGLSPERSDSLGVKLRKSLFESQSQVWGYRAKSSYICQIFRSSDENTLDMCQIAGYTGLYKLRRDAKIRMNISSSPAWFATRTDEASPMGVVEDPILLAEFSRGIQVISNAETWLGEGKQTVVDCAVGRSNPAELVTLIRMAGMPLQEPVEQSIYRPCVNITSPREVTYCDLLVPVGWTNSSTSRVRVFFPTSDPEQIWKTHPDDLLPMRESVAYRGRVRPTVGSGMPTIAEVPRYQELVRTVVTDLGWSETEFDVYRCRIEYPIPHSLIELHVDGARMKR